MPLLDLFGLGKSGAKKTPEEITVAHDASEADKEPSRKEPVHAEAPTRASGRSKRFWGAFLAVDVLALVLCAGFAGMRAVSSLRAPAQPQRTARVPKAKKEPKKDAAPAEPKREEQKPAEPEKKPEPKKQDAPKSDKPAPLPAGSPSVHAKDLPKRAPEPKTPQKDAAPAARKKPAQPAQNKSVSKPISFDYSNPEAKEVSLVGMFLVRTGGSKPMFKNAQGTWKITIYLNTGYTYRYQFEVVDKMGRKTLTPVKTIDVF